MNTGAVIVIAVALLIAFFGLLRLQPAAMAEALSRIKVVKVGRILGIEFYERAIIDREGRKPDRRELQEAADKIKAGRILWVDDAPENNLLEIQALRMLGVAIDIATTNEEAGRYLKSVRYDLVLSDIDRVSPTENGDVGLAMPQVIRAAGRQVELAYYIGTKTDDAVPSGQPVFDTPTELLLHVVTVLGKGSGAMQP
jgi:CheY-like chemotaxis protein